MKTFKILLPGALEQTQGFQAGDVVKFQTAEENDATNRFVVRALVNQMPGQQFTNYQSLLLVYQSLGGVPVIMSNDDYTTLLNQDWEMFPLRKT